jgi:hypothetical protein
LQLGATSRKPQGLWPAAARGTSLCSPFPSAAGAILG